MVSRNIMYILCVFTLFFGCGSEPDDREPVIINTHNGTTANLEGNELEREYAELTLCSVLLRFVFKETEGIEVQFENWNDTTAVVDVQNQTTGGLVVSNCLWADGEDIEPAHFSSGDELLVSVYLGSGQFFHWTCVKSLDELFGNFPLCDNLIVVIQ